MRIEIRPCTIAELEAAPNVRALLDEYTAESAIAELGPTVRDLSAYRAMEAAGFLCMIGAFSDDNIVGFITLMIAPLPHFGARLVATTESFFVTAAERRRGAGFGLLHEAERIATEAGAIGLLVSAPATGRLAAVLSQHKPYRETNRVFFRSLMCSQ